MYISLIGVYRKAGYLYQLKVLRMSLMYLELVIFTVILFVTLNLVNGIKVT